jgi:protocatechuate 3,4-dioxygenase beta subunit
MFDRRLGPVAVVCLVLAVVGVAGASQELSGPTRQRTSGFGTDAAAQQSAAIQGTAVIRGRVLSADANAPLRKARVRLSSSSEPNVSRTVVTDNNGYYSFTRVSPGRYSLNASKGGFVPVNYGQARPLGPGHPLELADRQVIEKVDFLLPRGGAISGRVVDEFGEPVSDLQVRAFKRSYFQGSRRLVPTGRVGATDDTGFFRIWGLPPGGYSVGTVQSISPDSDDGFIYPATFCPGTTDGAVAAHYVVKAADEIRGADLALLPSRVATISGVAWTSSGQPAAGATVAVGQTISGLNTEMSTSLRRTVARADGTFEVDALGPGTYDVVMSVPGTEQGAATRIQVNGGDIGGLSLRASVGASVVGNLFLENGRSVDELGQSVRVTAPLLGPRPIVPIRRGATPTSAVTAEGSFELRGLDGPRLIRVGGLPSGWMLKSVTRDGKDITDTPLELAGDARVEGVEVLLTSAVTGLGGHVTDARGEVAGDCTVVVFAEDPALWTYGSRFLVAAKSDQQGTFEIHGLPPGRYLAVAVDSLQDGDEADPEFLERCVKLATRLVLVGGEKTELGLRVVKPDFQP